MKEKKGFEMVVRYPDLDKVPASVTDDAEIEVIPLGRTYHGKEELREYAEWFFGSLSDIEIEVIDTTVSKGVMVSEIMVRATHTGPFLGYAPTGKRIEIRACRVFTLRDGLVHHGRIYYDLATVLRQIGAMEELKAA